jgi:hypothetical protein
LSDPQSHGFKEHGLMLYLSPSLYMGFIKLQGDKGLGRSFAGLLAFNEGMHELGYIQDSEYEANKIKYSRKLVPEVPAKPLTLQEQAAKNERDSLARAFGSVVEQWDMAHVDPHWKEKWLAKAEKHQDTIPAAKHLIEMVNKKVKVIVQEGLLCQT